MSHGNRFESIREIDSGKNRVDRLTTRYDMITTPPVSRAHP